MCGQYSWTYNYNMFPDKISHVQITLRKRKFKFSFNYNTFQASDKIIITSWQYLKSYIRNSFIYLQYIKCMLSLDNRFRKNLETPLVCFFVETEIAIWCQIMLTGTSVIPMNRTSWTPLPQAVSAIFFQILKNPSKMCSGGFIKSAVFLRMQYIRAILIVRYHKHWG